MCSHQNKSNESYIKRTYRIRQTAKKIVITHGLTELTLDKKTGSIVKISNARTGIKHCAAGGDGGGRLFRIVAMMGRDRAKPYDSHVQAKMFATLDNTGITLDFPALECRGQHAGISARVRIECYGEDEIRFTMTIRNDGEEIIHEVQFPMIASWTKERPAKMTCGAKAEHPIGALPHYGYPAYAKWHQQFSVDYPGASMYFPWFDISGKGGGLSYINYMEKPYFGGVGGINLAGHEKGSAECFWWKHYPLIKKGRSWSTPPVGVALHDDDWHATADRYYQWFTSVITPLQQPDSLRTAIGFQNIMLRSFDGTRINEIESLTEHARAGRKYGIKHLSVWDYLMLGNYTIYEKDLDLFNYTDEEQTRLQKAIAAVKQEGTTISGLVNFRHINVRSTLYDEYKSEAVLCLDGSECRENWCVSSTTSPLFTTRMGLNAILLSPRSPKTRERIRSLLDKYLALGYNALFYDQPFLYQIDYNLRNTDDQPYDGPARLYEIIKEVRELMQANDRKAYLIGEQFDVFSCSLALDLHMEWNFTNRGIDDLARTHYACPHALLSYVIDYTTSGEAQASKAFAAGLYLCITIDGCEANIGKRPALARHIKQLADLRKKCAARTVYAVFRETRGLELKCGHGITACAYDSPEGPAIVIAAGEKGGKARVLIDLNRFQTPPDRIRGKVYTMDGKETNVGNKNNLSYTLKPNEVIVWYC